MVQPFAEFRSETAYDALLDGLSLVVHVLAEPATLEELVAAGYGDRATLERQLRRLQRAGILRLEAGKWQPVARMVVSFRQEGMVTFLSRHVLPSFVELVRDPNQGFITLLDLDLPIEVQRGLTGGLVQDLLNELNALSDEPSRSRKPGTLVAVGTFDVPPANREREERILEVVRRSARQKTSASEAERAVMTYYDARFPADRLDEAAALVRRAAERIGAHRAAEGQANYTLVLGFRADFRSGVGEEK